MLAALNLIQNLKKALIVMAIGAAIASCKSEEDKLKEKMLPVLTGIVLKDSVVTRIDSIIIYDIDTLTDKLINQRKAGTIPSLVDSYLTITNIHLATADMHTENVRNKHRQARLYNYLGSTELAKLELEEAEEERRKIIKEANTAQKYTDSAKVLDEKRVKLLKDIEDGKTDSTTFRGYVPRFRLIGADKNGVQVKKDSLYIFLSKEMSIIPNKVI